MDPRMMIENVNSIFSFPDVALRINELINLEETTNAELEQLIIHDPALTAKILKLANSSYFGCSGKIETISRAITLIGHKELRNLVMAISVISIFEGISSDLVDMEAFWYHSITCGVMARSIATHLKSKEQERFFISGLLHDIGKLVLFSQFPKESAQTLRFKDQGDDAVIEAERKIFGFTHAELGAELLKQWQLPMSIWKLVQFQLDPLNEEAPKRDACILHVAAHIANCVEPCARRTGDLDKMKPTYKIEAWNQLDLSPEFIPTMMSNTGLQVFDILSVIKPEALVIL